MPHTYILFSVTHNKTYVGCTEDVPKRLAQHNQGRVTATHSGRPWIIVMTEDHPTMLEARRRERYLKSSAGRRWLKKTLGVLQ